MWKMCILIEKRLFFVDVSHYTSNPNERIKIMTKWNEKQIKTVINKYMTNKIYFHKHSTQLHRNTTSDYTYKTLLYPHCFYSYSPLQIQEGQDAIIPYCSSVAKLYTFNTYTHTISLFNTDTLFNRTSSS